MLGPNVGMWGLFSPEMHSSPKTTTLGVHLNGDLFSIPFDLFVNASFHELPSLIEQRLHMSIRNLVPRAPLTAEEMAGGKGHVIFEHAEKLAVINFFYAF